MNLRAVWESGTKIDMSFMKAINTRVGVKLSAPGALPCAGRKKADLPPMNDALPFVPGSFPKHPGLSCASPMRA